MNMSFGLMPFLLKHLGSKMCI